MRAQLVGRSNGRRVAQWVCSCLGAVLVLHGAGLQAQATPARTRIITVADLTFEVLSGGVIRMSSAPDTIVVGELAGVTFQDISPFGPAGPTTTDPHTTVYFSHTVVNTGNISDTFAVSLQSRKGWAVRVYRDVNKNGLFDAGDTLVTAPIALLANTGAPLLFAVDVPAGTTLRGSADTLQFAVRSGFAPATIASVTDQLQIRTAGILITLTQSVDKTTVTPGDVLTYTVNYVASGPSSATNFQLVDPVPEGTTYIAGTLKLNGHTVTDAAGDDPGVFDAATGRLVVTLATITGGDTGSVTFQVRVSP